MSDASEMQKEQFVKLVRYTTPATIGILLYVAFSFLDGEPITTVLIGIFILIESFIGLKADTLYDYFQETTE